MNENSTGRRAIRIASLGHAAFAATLIGLGILGLVTDDICLGFRVHEDGTFWSVSEDFIGYKELVAELERRFSGIRTDWFADVAFPAFALNRTTLWGQTDTLEKSRT